MEVDYPKPVRRKAPEPPVDNVEEDNFGRPIPATRKNRLDALAKTINTWEDDLTRHTVKYVIPPFIALSVCFTSSYSSKEFSKIYLLFIYV